MTVTQALDSCMFFGANFMQPASGSPTNCVGDANEDDSGNMLVIAITVGVINNNRERGSIVG
jgi:hypothetical protein